VACCQVFDEVLSFLHKGIGDSMLDVEVFDADSLSDDCLGKRALNVNRLDLQVGVAVGVATSVAHVLLWCSCRCCY